MSGGRSTATSWWRRVVDRQTIAIASVYAAAWGLILLNGGRYWDDWCMLGLTREGALLWGSMTGQRWHPVYWLAMNLPYAPYVAHALTFGLFLASALFLNRLLRRIPGTDPTAQVMIPMIFAVFPVNGARMAHIDFPYTLSTAAFYLAWYLVAVDIERPRLARRALSAILFVFALFTMNSLLVFIVLVPLYVFWINRSALGDRSVRRNLLARYSFLVALPLVAWGLRSWIAQPWGLYVEYNVLRVADVIQNLRDLPTAFFESVIKPLASAWPVALVGIAIWFLLRRKRTSSAGDSSPDYRLLVGGGLLAFVLGVFPYIAVGKIPQAVGTDWWDSRHQVLVPLGAALLLYAVVVWLVKLVKLDRSVATAVLLGLVVGFVVADLQTSLAYQADWYKQVSLMRHIANSEDIYRGNYFIVHDETTDLNVNGRRYLPYELSGMMYMVYGETTRFALDDGLNKLYANQLSAYKPYEQYHWQKYEGPSREYLVTITAGGTDISSDWTVLGLMWRERLAPREFERRVYDILDVRTEWLSSSGAM